MKLLPRMFFVFVVTWLPLAAAAADPVWTTVPDNAGVVLRIAPPATLAGKIRDFARNAAPPFAGLADQLPPALGSLIENPTLAGIDANRSWYVFVFPKAEGRPAVVFAAPIGDEPALRKALDSKFTLLKRETWMLYSKDAEVMGQIDKPGEAQLLAGTLVGETAELLESGEIGLFLNVPSLRTTYGEQLKKGFEEGMQQAAAAGGNVNNDMNRKVLALLTRAVEDLSSVVVRLSFEPQALTKRAVLSFEPGSETAAFLARQQPSKLALLNRLPDEELMYFAAAMGAEDLLIEAMKLSAAMYGSEEEAILGLADEFRQVKLQEFASSVQLGDLAGGVLNSVTLVDVEPAEKYRELVRKTSEKLSHLEMQGVQQDIRLQADAETIEGQKVDLVTVRTTMDPKHDPTGFGQKFQTILFGEDGATQRMTTSEGLFIQTAGDQSVMQQALAALAKNESQTLGAGFTETRGKVAGEANFLMLVDLPRTAARVIDIAGQTDAFPLVIDREAIAALGFEPSYAGSSARMNESNITFDAILPAAQVRGLIDLFGVLQTSSPKR